MIPIINNFLGLLTGTAFSHTQMRILLVEIWYAEIILDLV